MSLTITAAQRDALYDQVLPERHGGQLRLGDAIYLAGQLSGGGGLIATQVHSGPPPASESWPSNYS